jgi:transposase
MVSMNTPTRKPYPTDVSDEEWAFLAPYLTLMREDAPQRQHSLRELFNGLRFIARAGLQWRFMPNDLPPWHAIYQQTRRWIDADVFTAIIADLRELIRIGKGRAPQPSAMILDSRTLQSTPESGDRAGRGETAQGVHGSSRRRYVGTAAGIARHTGHRAGS